MNFDVFVLSDFLCLGFRWTCVFMCACFYFGVYVCVCVGDTVEDSRVTLSN